MRFLSVFDRKIGELAVFSPEITEFAPGNLSFLMDSTTNVSCMWDYRAI